jgi:serine/threonine protein kinase
VRFGDLKGGDILGKEEVVKQLTDVYSELKGIGKGGSSTIFRAKRLEDGEIVAIKILKKDERSESEISISELPPHENVLAYLTSNKLYQNGGERIVLEGQYFESTALMGHGSEVLNELKLKDKLFIMLSIAKALDHLHNNGKIHRDVKPENVLVRISENEEITDAKLIDYGVSKTVSDDQFDGITSTKDFIGTERTSSPHALSSSKDYDVLDDIYSAGVTFIEILLGRKWTADMPPAEIKMYQYDIEFEKLINRLTELPLWLSELLSAMTYKNKKERTKDMSIIVEALYKQRVSDWWLNSVEKTYKKYKINLNEWEDRKVVAKCVKCGLIYTFKGRTLATKIGEVNLEWSDLKKDHFFPTECIACREKDSIMPMPFCSYTYYPGKIIEMSSNTSKNEKSSEQDRR